MIASQIITTCHTRARSLHWVNALAKANPNMISKERQSTFAKNLCKLSCLAMLS